MLPEIDILHETQTYDSTDNNVGIIIAYQFIAADDVTEEIPSDDGSIRIAGLQSFLFNENYGQIIMLPILEHDVNEVNISEIYHNSIYKASRTIKTFHFI